MKSKESDENQAAQQAFAADRLYATIYSPHQLAAAFLGEIIFQPATNPTR